MNMKDILDFILKIKWSKVLEFILSFMKRSPDHQDEGHRHTVAPVDAKKSSMTLDKREEASQESASKEKNLVVDKSYEFAYTCCKFSDIVYDYEKKSDHRPYGWEVIENIDLKDEPIFAVAFVNEKDKRVVIAYRGTDPTFNRTQDVINDAHIAVGSFSDNTALLKVIGVDPPGRKYAEEFADKITKKEKYKDYKFTFTGHSLGGGLANIGAAFTDKPAITFDAPGVASFIKKANIKQNLFTNYIFDKNPINTAGKRLGKIIKLPLSSKKEQYLQIVDGVGEAAQATRLGLVARGVGLITTGIRTNALHSRGEFLKTLRDLSVNPPKVGSKPRGRYQ